MIGTKSRKNHKIVLALMLLVFVWLVTGCCEVGNHRGRICRYDLRWVFPDQKIIRDRIVFKTSEYFNIVIGGRILAVRNPGAKPLAWSPDGTALLLEIPRPGSIPLYHLAILREPKWSQFEYIQMDIYGLDHNANWGPDNDWIVFMGVPDYYTIHEDEFLSRRGMYILNLRSGEKRKIGDGYCNPTWSPNGRMIAAVTYIAEAKTYGLQIIDLEEDWARDSWVGPVDKKIVYLFSTKHKCLGMIASWFPDSQRLLVTDGLKIMILNLNDGSIKTIYEINTPRSDGYLRAKLLSGGHHVVYQASYTEGWCQSDRDCWNREPDGAVHTSWCGGDSGCWHQEIMLADLDEMVWRNITPKVEGYNHPVYYDELEFEWWQQR